VHHSGSGQYLKEAAEGYFCEGLQSKDKKLECDVEQISQERATAMEGGVQQARDWSCVCHNRKKNCDT